MESIKDKVVSFVSDKVKEYVYTEIKDRMGFEVVIDVPPTHPIYTNFLEFISKYDKHFKHHIIKEQNFIELKSSVFVVKIRKDTFMIIRSGTKVYDELSATIEHMTSTISLNKIVIYIFGKKSYAVKKYIEDKIMTVSDRYDKLPCYTIVIKDGYLQANYTTKRKRFFDTIFYENNIIDSIKDHIDMFLQNKTMYMTKNITYKTGILLQGEPGTGKTTLASVIASEYNCDLIIIDMASFEWMDVSELSSIIDNDDKMYVVLLEDIDCVVKDRDKDISNNDNKVINKLLQLLDSNSSPNNVIFICTTNYPDKIDSAIKRSGRIDLIVSINGLSYDRARDMCRSFRLNDSTIDDIMVSMKEKESYRKFNNYNQSDLQNEILSRLTVLQEVGEVDHYSEDGDNT